MQARASAWHIDPLRGGRHDPPKVYVPQVYPPETYLPEICDVRLEAMPESLQ